MLKKSHIFKIVTGMVLTATLAISAIPGIGSGKLGSSVVDAAQTKPKYVFYMIGDGLGSSQRQISEYFIQDQKGNKDLKLTMNIFPVAGMNTTHSADTLVTDSAASGTALATGHKTNNGVISQLPDGTNVKTLVEEAEAKGMATGIITTTRLTHATPAVFASHNADRDNENEIAADYVDSGVEFFAGGGARHFAPKDGSFGKSKREDDRNLFGEFQAEGYKIFSNESQTSDFRGYHPDGQEKVLATFAYSHLPYEIDRMKTDDTPSLAEITEKGIEVLSEYDNGFFMMVEGGRIDHACHANDAPGAIYDTLAFDDAVKKAYDFYKKHPTETLIVVTADHETGGLGMGFGKNYFINLKPLEQAKISVEDTLQGAYTGDRDAFFTYLASNMGLTNLTDDETAEITKAMDIKDGGTETKAYGGYDAVAIAATHVLSERANIFWTTYAHSGTVIPLSAIGVNSSSFGGYKDNTEVAQTMAKVMGFQLTK